MTSSKTLGAMPGLASVSDDPRWRRILARDRSADGEFWYSVATTGVYCRPSCPSRHAKPQNVRIHETVQGARADGFRSCKRCNPDGPSVSETNLALAERACRMIEECEHEPQLSQIADSVGLSPSLFHRLFKTEIGLTPKQYAAGVRVSRVREGLESGDTVTEVVFRAGYNSSSRFYEKAKDFLGMTPQQYRAGGKHEKIWFALGEASLGSFLVATSLHGVVAILLGDDPHELLRDLQNRFPGAELIGADNSFEILIAQVVGLVDSPSKGHGLPLDIRGSAFQQRVWHALLEIPCGETASYSEIAKRIGAPTAARAVARACAANKLAVAIPCHRVIKNDGSVSGYAWGIEVKRALLEEEAGASPP